MNAKNDFIKIEDYNVVYPIKYNKNIFIEFISDLVPSFSDKFIYDYENLKVKGADGYCIINRVEHARLLSEQSKGFDIIYDGKGGVTTYKKPPLPNDTIWYKPQYDYELEIWEEMADKKTIANMEYEAYLTLDTPRHSRVMIRLNIIDDYDDYINNLLLFIEDKISELPKPSEELLKYKLSVL